MAAAVADTIPAMLLVLEHSDSAPSQRLGERLIQYGHRLRVRRLHRGDELPANLSGIDGVITCGGEQSATDDGLSWLAGEMELLRAAHGHALPIVGICLGSQILARSLGGEVTRMARGIELGWHSVALNPVGFEEVLHAGIAWSSMQPLWLRDEVS
jgi:GMP synthase-like glutamine amidotransferase